jgi:hypothetical protein
MLDADDVALPERLERQVRFLESWPGLAGAASRAILFVRPGKPLGVSAVAAPASIEDLNRLKASGRLLVLCHPTMMWRRDSLLALDGYDERFTQACDAEVVNRAVYLRGWPFLVMQEPLVWYRLSPSGMSSRGLAQQRRMLRYLEVRNRAWIRGVPAPSLESFLSRPVGTRTRMTWWRHDTAAELYRRAGINIGLRAWGRAIGSLVAAAALHPRYVLSKLWHQRIRSGPALLAAGRARWEDRPRP